METFDRKREQQVWQRVNSPLPAPPREGLRVLRRESLILAGIYRQLMSSLTGKTAEKAAQLYREETATAAVLRGLELLRGEDNGKSRPLPPPREPTMRLLHHCYRRTRNCQAEYTARSLEADFGGVFRVLADRAEQQCARIAELMGML